MYNKRRSNIDWPWVWTVVGVLAVAIFVGAVIDNGRPRSSQGVERVSHTVARITKDDTLVLKESGGKSRHTHYWVITFDGDDTVRFKEDGSWFPRNHTFTLCGIDCEVETKVGSIFNHVTLTERSDSVEVNWPKNWYWHFREYQPPSS